MIIKRGMNANKPKKANIGNILIYAALTLMALVMLYPIVFISASSFMRLTEILNNYGKIYLIPYRVTIQNYYDVFVATPDYLAKFWISLFITLSISVGQLAVSCLGGYGFAKFKFPLKNFFFYLLILLMMMPYQVILVPNYIMLDKMGLIGSYASVVIPGMFAPFGIFLLKQVYSSIPDSVIEAAKIDGANQMQILAKIIVPYAKNGIAALFILCFIDNWNMVEQPLIYLKDPFKYPLSIFLSVINNYRLDLAFVCSILAMLPVVIIFLYLKESLVYGIEKLNFK
ncbi:MAG: carbohydrate ABC transporter permease [Oscillospiraceae bacterium]|nr:carbohydrate ABC transporter permease [Oscillospiraceae bacterium]